MRGLTLPELEGIDPAPPGLHAARGQERPQIVSPMGIPGWDELVRTHADSTFFHGSAWAKVLQQSYDFAPRYFTTWREGQLETLVPLMEMNSLLTGRRGVSLPFTDVCEPLLDAHSGADELIPRLVQYGRERRWRSLEFRCRRDCFHGLRPSLSYYGHRLSLFPDEEEIFSRFKSEVRTAIRKAISAGVEVELSTHRTALREFLALHRQTRRRHGLPSQPARFFDQIQRQILSTGHGFVGLARHRGKPISAAIFFHLGRKAEYKFAAGDLAAQSLRGANLVLWEAVRYYRRRGFAWLDFGRTALAQEGLRRFKRGWGTREDAIEYYHYDFRQAAFVRKRDAALGWHTRICRRLPLWCCRWLGRLLYRHAG